MFPMVPFAAIADIPIETPASPELHLSTPSFESPVLHVVRTEIESAIVRCHSPEPEHTLFRENPGVHRSADSIR